MKRQIASLLNREGARENKSLEEEKMAKKKKMKKKGGKKKAFGGYTINFKGCNDPIAKVFGTTPVAPSQMTKKLWAYVKRKHLNKA